MHQNYDDLNFVGKDKISNKIPLIESLTKQEIKKLQDYSNKVYDQGVQAGIIIDYNWTQLALFKMWQELELLDYESIIDRIDYTIDAFYKDKEILNVWNKKYAAYLSLAKKNRTENDEI